MQARFGIKITLENGSLMGEENNKIIACSLLISQNTPSGVFCFGWMRQFQFCKRAG